jgi:hypothetical protein
MAAKKKAGGAAAPASPPEEHVGTVEHYYPKVKAAAVKLDADLKLGDTIHIKGHSDDYTEKVTSMQLDHEPIQAGHPGESVGVRVPVKVHEHSEVTKVLAPKPAARAAAPKARKAAKAPARGARKAAKKAPKRGKATRKRGKAKKARRAKARKAPKRKSASSRRRAGKRPAGRRKR